MPQIEDCKTNVRENLLWSECADHQSSIELQQVLLILHLSCISTLDFPKTKPIRVKQHLVRIPNQ